MVRRGEAAGKDGRRGMADESAVKGVRVHADSENNRRRIAQPRVTTPAGLGGAADADQRFVARR
jgi:hypothetical protein